MQPEAFRLLHPKVQQVVLNLRWTNLYPIQEETIRHIAQCASDLIVAAPTSGGKTEAVFLPILSRLLGNPPIHHASIQVLCISPLKALINDQFARLTRLCKPLDVPVHRWHGDVEVEAKRWVRERPSGLLLITPESVESLFINYPHYLINMFRGLQFVVVDELHSLLESERGMHIRSLLARLKPVIKRRPICIGLSATLGDPFAARCFLNSDNPESVLVISDRSTARPISVEVIPVTASGNLSNLGIIAEDMRRIFCDGSHLVFANSRRIVEELADHFLGHCQVDAEGEPALALHHGSLSAQVRRRTESMLKSGKPTRALCTSSLELGIDIGAVEAVAQIDPTWSVASMVQRLGRSGRSIGATSKLRLYVRVPPLQEEVSFVELLYPPLLQAVAMMRLLLSGWLESVNAERLHLSTLVHQVLSVLKETGGRDALALYQTLCREGAFRRVEPADFKSLLQGLRDHDLINQDSEGIIFLGRAGERITSAPSFYAAFCTPVELTVRCGARELGRISASVGLKEGECLILNGGRWLIDQIDWKAKTVWVSATSRRQAPVFLGGVGEVDNRIYEEMRRVLVTAEEPDWLERNGLDLLRSARHAALEAGLLESDLVELENGVQWFPWVGTRTMRTLQLWAKHVGLSCTKDSLSLMFEDTSRTDLEKHLTALTETEIDAVELAAVMPNKQVERFDSYVAKELLDKSNAECRLDLASAKEAARRTLVA